MLARVCFGSKNSFGRGPASSNSSSGSVGADGSRTISAGIRACSLTECRSGEGNRASPREVMFMCLFYPKIVKKNRRLQKRRALDQVTLASSQYEHSVSQFDKLLVRATQVQFGICGR